MASHRAIYALIQELAEGLESHGRDQTERIASLTKAYQALSPEKQEAVDAAIAVVVETMPYLAVLGKSRGP
jgi:hypothetical protein